jgi:hypothetical protein
MLLVLGTLACTNDVPDRRPEQETARAPHSVIVQREGLGTLRNPAERGGGIPCATCHPPAGWTSMAAGVHFGMVHGNVVVDHGDLRCFSCHDRDDRGSLHLAEGLRIPFSSAQRLCAQCHGPQTRDYDNGAHGGMSGHWDSDEGPALRNPCVACHSPHAPAYPTVGPAPGPRDRDPLLALDAEGQP